MADPGGSGAGADTPTDTATDTREPALIRRLSADDRPGTGSPGERPRLRVIAGSSLIRNSTFLMLTTVANSLIGYLYWLLAARAYSSGSIGLAASLISVFSLTSVLTCLGISSLFIQVLPSLSESDDWSALFLAGTLIPTAFTFVVSAAAAWALAISDPGFSLLRHLDVFAVCVLGGAFSTSAIALDASFIALRKSGQLLIRNTVFCVGKIVFMLFPLLLTKHPTVLELMGSWALGTAVSFVVGVGWQMPAVNARARWFWRGGFARFRQLWRSAVAHYFTWVGSQIPQYLIPPIVLAMVSPAAAGYFYLTWSVGAAFMMVSPSVTTALFAEGSNRADLRTSVQHTVLFLAVLLIPAMIVCLVVGDWILSLFGPAYASHGLALFRVLVLGAVPDAITNIYISVWRVRGTLARAASLNLFMVAVQIILTVVLLPRYNIVAVGYAWFISQCLGVGLAFLMNRSSTVPAVGTTRGPVGDDDVVAVPTTGSLWLPAQQVLAVGEDPQMVTRGHGSETKGVQAPAGGSM